MMHVMGQNLVVLSKEPHRFVLKSAAALCFIHNIQCVLCCFPSFVFVVLADW